MGSEYDRYLTEVHFKGDFIKCICALYKLMYTRAHVYFICADLWARNMIGTSLKVISRGYMCPSSSIYTRAHMYIYTYDRAHIYIVISLRFILRGQ